MKVRRKSLWRSANNKRAKKFANMRAAKERKRIERLAIEPVMPDMAHVKLPRMTTPLFTVSIRCRDGEAVKFCVHELPHGLSISPTLAGRKLAAIIKHYRPV